MRSSLPQRLKPVVIAAALMLPLSPAHAGLISTDQLASEAKAQQDRDKIRAFLNRADAERSLVSMGVEPRAAKDRVDALTTSEAAEIAGKIDALPAGGVLSNNSLIIILLVAILVAVLI